MLVLAVIFFLKYKSSLFRNERYSKVRNRVALDESRVARNGKALFNIIRLRLGSRYKRYGTYEEVISAILATATASRQEPLLSNVR